MAIIEKPAGPNEVFATPEEALRQQKPALTIPESDFNESLASPDVQAALNHAHARRDACAEEPSP
jgi:hypothetical protein